MTLGEHAAPELIYRAEIQFIETLDYGVSMEALTGGKAPIPAGGARFDQTFEGVLRGPRLRGTIAGIDYLNVRGDGLFQLHLHARVTTEAGAHIALASEGVSLQVEGERQTQLRASVSLFTAAEAYAWVNKLPLWAVGSLDPATGQASIEAYAP